MKNNSSKAKRRINCLDDIQEQIHDFLNDGSDDGDFIEENDIIGDSENKERNIYCLYDFMKASLLTKQSTKKGRKKSCKVPTSSRERNSTKIYQDGGKEKITRRVCYGGHNIKEEDRKILLYLQSKSPWLHFSRLGKNLRGSTKILCFNFKVAFLLIWNVGEAMFDIHVIPIINCSTLRNSSIHSICKSMSKKLHLQFEKQLNTQGKSDFQSKDDVFHELNCFIVNCENDMSMQLSKQLCSLSELDLNLSAPLEKILKESTSVNVERSLDYFDVFAWSNIDCDQLVENIHANKSSDESFCAICFDPFEDNGVHLRTCCHKFCDSCWKGLVRSSSSSGDAVIRCPAYKCKEVLNMRDIAHLLFDKAEEITTQDMIVLMNLIKFKMDQTLLDKKFKHCSTPSCNRIFASDPFLPKDVNNSETRRMKVCLCKCGASRCSYCEGPAHFGISCMASKRIRKEVESGRIDNELRSLLWLQRNCTPCPKCNLPINKTGGCNHMRCGKCKYYFCWVCGGDGVKCGAYLCKRTGVATFGKNETASYLSEGNVVANQVLSIKQYSDALMDLEHCIKWIATGAHETNPQANRELQLRKSLTWLRGCALDKSLSYYYKKRQNYIVDVATTVELTLGFLTNTFGTNEISAVLKDEETITRPVQRHYNYKKKHVSKPLRNEMKYQRESDEKMTSFNEILQVKKIQSMNGRQFNAHISSVLNEAVQQLVNTGKNRKKFVDENERYTLSLLNKREKPLKAPWKGESRFDAPEMIIRDMSTKLQDKPKIKTKKIQWKGKSKVKSRRSHALNLREVKY